MFFEWENDTGTYLAEVSKALGGKLEFRGGKSQVPHPLYETLLTHSMVIPTCTITNTNSMDN